MKIAKNKQLTDLRKMSFVFFIIAFSSLLLGFFPIFAYFQGNEVGFFVLSGLFSCLGLYTFQNS